MTDTKTVPCEPTRLDLEAIAKDAAERVHKNGGCVPQLAFAPILFALQDARAAAPAHQPDRQGAGESVAVCPECQGKGCEWCCNGFVEIGAAAPPPADTAMREAPIDLIYDLAKKGRDKAGCDGWRAQEMCREIADIIERATLSRRDAAEGRG